MAYYINLDTSQRAHDVYTFDMVDHEILLKKLNLYRCSSLGFDVTYPTEVKPFQ